MNHLLQLFILSPLSLVDYEVRGVLILTNFAIPTTIDKSYVNQAMTGLLLGDGSLVKKYVGGGTYFKFCQSTIHTEYLNHVFNLFKKVGYLHMNAPSFQTLLVKGKTYHAWQFNSITFRSWNTLQRLWYVDGVKVIPHNIFDLLTPIAMAHWLMDDGGWTGKAIHLNTNAFSKVDVLRLIAVLETKYGLKCGLHSRNRVYIWTPSCPKFLDIVRPHVHPSMSYKVTIPNK